MYKCVIVTMLEAAIPSRITHVFDIAKDFTMSERLVLAKLLLDSLVVEEVKSETNWHNDGVSSFAEEWDSPEDAIRNQPAKLAENKSTYQTNRIGNLHPGSFRVHNDFDAPLPEEFWLGKP